MFGGIRKEFAAAEFLTNYMIAKSKFNEARLLIFSGATFVLMVLVFVAVVKKKWEIPTDSELIENLDKNSVLFEKYVDLFNENTNLSQIYIVSDKAEDGVEISYNSTSYKEIELTNEVLIQDIYNTMNIRRIKRSFCRGEGCSDPEEILFISHNVYLTKGIAYRKSDHTITLVDDLSDYGTKNDPRIGTENSPEHAYIKIREKWYLFGG